MAKYQPLKPTMVASCATMQTAHTVPLYAMRKMCVLLAVVQFATQAEATGAALGRDVLREEKLGNIVDGARGYL